VRLLASSAKTKKFGNSEMQSDSKEFGSHFGPSVDLTTRIREILRNYPEGSSIFKEILQNADDAKARGTFF